MTERDQIIAWAREAHGPITGKWWDMDTAALQRFASLVAAHEREKWARLVLDDAHAITFQTIGQYRTALAAAIRGRAEK